ncbi:MAG: ATP-binding protein, partial [Thermoanaerobaculia bacterium]|nr:ATP-binding protein [Thermoanaerobaculia bacterium]
GVEVELELDDDLEVPAGVELQLLRIIQEALSNVRKHSGADEAAVTVRREGDRIVAAVRDDGVGFDPQLRRSSSGPRFGLAIMRERAEGVGGTMQLVSSAGRGTVVAVELPLTESVRGVS